MLCCSNLFSQLIRFTEYDECDFLARTADKWGRRSRETRAYILKKE
jgi:hypothetical protein